jgi:hypothetical protein
MLGALIYLEPGSVQITLIKYCLKYISKDSLQRVLQQVAGTIILSP